MVCAVTGLSRTCPGEGLGAESASEAPVLEPVLSYQLLLPEGCDPHAAMGKLTQLEEEDPQLHLVWDEGTRQIRVQLMGEIQLEVLQRVIAERFGWQVAFGEGSIVYKETIASTVEGIGHFEPLRHYAEVHLLLEPGERGSGLQLESACPEDQLDRSWQRLIFTHLQERDFPGVLTGSPVTDLRITLLTGRAHIKHTEGGDFRQATYRAVRQGLMQAESVLLEPWYDVRLELPADCVGRAMSDLQMKAGRLLPPELNGEEAVLTGSVPVVELRTYAAELAAYTRGRGRMLCTLRGYEPCHNAEEVIAAIGYDAERDAENPADSVFCAHGGGYLVPWYEVAQHAHVSSGRGGTEEPQLERTEPRSASRSARTAGTFEEDQELRAIFERTYGPVRQRRGFDPQIQQRRQETERKRAAAPQPAGPEYLLVDGYNIIYAWDELTDAALLAEPAEDVRRLPGYRHGFHLAEYAASHSMMFSGAPELIVLRLPETLAGYVRDTFGKQAQMRQVEGGAVEVRIMSTPQNVRFFALQYGPSGCEVLRPESLRRQLGEDAAALAGLYRQTGAEHGKEQRA